MDGSVVTEAVGRQTWLDPVADGLQTLVSASYEAGGDTCQAVESFLHGEWMGHPLHPALIAVPLGAWTVAAAMDAADAAGAPGAAAAADAAVAVGLVGAAAAIPAGVTDWYKTSGQARRVGVAHGVLNLAVTGLYLGSWLLRKRNARSSARALAWTGYGISALSGYLGGLLVYNLGMGVEKQARPRLAPPAQPAVPAPQLEQQAAQEQPRAA